MKIANIVLTLSFLLSAITAHATQVTKSYLLGDEKIISPTGQPLDTKALFIEKTVDPDNSRMTERAIEVSADKTANEYTMNLQISGSTFTISDTQATLTGTGKLLGAPWQWTYFKAEYQVKNGMRIEDEDFMADPSALTSHKTIFNPDGTVLVYLDMTLKAISKDTFTLLTAALLKK